MNIIYFLVACSACLAFIFLLAFFWAQKTGQNDDLYTPSVRMLFDDEVSQIDETNKTTENKTTNKQIN